MLVPVRLSPCKCFSCGSVARKMRRPDLVETPVRPAGEDLAKIRPGVPITIAIRSHKRFMGGLNFEEARILVMQSFI